MKKAIIVDLDGTLCDCGHRLHYLEQRPKQWDNFYEECNKDECNEWCDQLIRGFQSQGFSIVLVTGRPEKIRDKTEYWLDWHAISYEKLFMRKNGDFRNDSVVKKEVYESKIKDRYNVQLVVEDRARVVKMWREIGLTCLQCKEGNY